MANEDLSKLKIDKGAGGFRPARRRRRLYGIAALLGIAVLIALYAFGVFSSAVTVRVATVSQTYPYQAYTVLNASGYVVAQRKASVSAKTTGRLVWLGVEEGSRVRKGEVIARLESDEVEAAGNEAAANLNVARAQLEQVQAELRDAEAAFAREKGLLEQGFTTRAEYDAALARYRKAQAAIEGGQAAIRAAQAALRRAEVNVEYTLIRAPFDAVVLTKNADVGDIITPLGAAQNVQAAVVTVADMESLQVEADVSESNIGQVRLKQPSVIQLDALPESRFDGQVHMIVPTADRTKATVLVKVGFLEKDKRILPQMSAKVAFLSHPVPEAEQYPRVAVTPAAVVSRNGTNVAFVVRQDKAVLTEVALGERLGDVVEVRSGLKPGDRVVLSPPSKLRSGARITIEEK